jgi:hypothetical protein
MLLISFSPFDILEPKHKEFVACENVVFIFFFESKNDLFGILHEVIVWFGVSSPSAKITFSSTLEI